MTPQKRTSRTMARRPARRAVALVAIGALTALGAVAPAAATGQAPPATAFAADASQPGVVGMIFWGAQGVPVRFYERVAGRLEPLGSARSAAGAPTTLAEATTWSCDRLVRRFEARATRPDGSRMKGSYGVRTRSCAQRFSLSAPRRVKRGGLLRIRIVDRWRIGGITTRLCLRRSGAKTSCRTLRFRRAVTIATRRVRLRREGRWRIELRVRRHRVRRTVAVGGARAARDVTPPAVLATGDSTMQGIDSFLADELGERAELTSDVRLGSAISRTSFWTRHAARQSKRLRPRVTVISVGAAFDSYPLRAPDGTEVECCDRPWMLAYSRRVRAMMRSYLRSGRGRVLWLTPPLPRDPVRVRILAAVVPAILRAADGLDRVGVVRIDELFAPGGVYTETIRWRGRDVRVRDADGVHLNVAGTAIVGQLLAPAIRRELGRR